MSQPVRVSAPPSKSCSHRAVIAASLAEGTSRLSNVLDSDDLTRTREIMAACSTRIKDYGGGALEIKGVAGVPKGGTADEPVQLFVNESGTTCRLITAVVGAGQGAFRIHGAPRMHERPMAELVRALRSQSVSVACEDTEGHLPLVINTNGFVGGAVTVGLDESSQYLSGLLLAAPLAKTESLIEISGEKVVSWPYVALTLQTLEDFGVPFIVEHKPFPGSTEFADSAASGGWRTIPTAAPGRVRFRLAPAAYQPRDLAVEGDWSNASYLLAAGVLGSVPVQVAGLRPDSLQGDRAILDILELMGAAIEWSGDRVTVSPSELRGLSVDMGHCPDLVPTVAVCAALAHGETTIRNVAHLKIKECDRLNAVAENLALVGVACEVGESSLTVVPNRELTQPSEPFRTFGDHRLAMCTSLLGLRGIRVVHDNPGCVAKSFPAFHEVFGTIADANNAAASGAER